MIKCKYISQSNVPFVNPNYCMFYIMGRSNPAYFKEKGGCSAPKLEDLLEPKVNVSCDNDNKGLDENNEVYHILWSIPMSEYPLDEWVNWRWEIKWSRYEPGSNGRTGLYSTTDASLTVYINKARRVQWTGKLGKVSDPIIRIHLTQDIRRFSF